MLKNMELLLQEFPVVVVECGSLSRVLCLDCIEQISYCGYLLDRSLNLAAFRLLQIHKLLDTCFQLP